METFLLEILTTFILGTIMVSEVKIIDKREKKKLIKQNKYQNFKVIDKTPILKLTKTNKQSNIKDDPKLQEIIQTFLNTLKIYLSEKEIENIKNRLQTLQYKKGNPLILKINNSSGYYSPQKHYIAVSQKKSIDQKTFENIIYHELLHAVTSYHHKTKNYSGFKQLNTKTKKVIGKFLNEGYTELLTQKLFGPNDNGGYPYEEKVAEIIELIIDQDKMQKLYFNIDLEGLINELAKYNNVNKVKQFILNIDTIDALYNSKGQYERETLTKLYNEVSIFLYETFQNKMEQTININNIGNYDFLSNRFLYLFNNLTKYTKFAQEEGIEIIKKIEKEEKKAYKEYLKTYKQFNYIEYKSSKKRIKEKNNNKGFINIIMISTLLTIISILSVGVSYLLLQAR